MKPLLSLVLFTALCCTATANELFPFVISFDAPQNVTNISYKNDAPAGKHSFVRIQDGYFATDAGRIKFWGTNTCFGANFLNHEQADRMADRMARFGINCVRLHHMDMRDIWGKNVDRTQMEFDKEQLDKLDYYIAALKKRGIYVNINLHVSRSLDERDGFPKNENRPSHDKGIDNYYRPFIEANKKYAKDLLEHINPYTGNAYKDEPAVAMIEINNENSVVCMWGGWGGLDVIQDPFLANLRKQWNNFLKAKYKTDDALKTAWKAKNEPLGTEMLRHGAAPGTKFSKTFSPNGDGWQLETDKEAKSIFTNKDGILQLDVQKKGSVSWHPQLILSGFSVKKEQPYTLTFRMKADKKAPVDTGLNMNHDPWGNLGFSTRSNLTADWQTFTYTFTPNADDDEPRVSFGGFSAGTVYEFESVSLKPGGNIGLPEGTSLAEGNIPVIWKKEVGNNTKETVDDFCDFLFEIEGRYWNEMVDYLKNDIKVKQPVSGTQLEYGFTHNQSRMDYCDIHAYWNHPSFPGRPWDGNNWYLHNRALVNHLDNQILPSLASKRVFGKPFTVSEYNHPYPNQYAAEGLPLLATFGAFQNWDAIFPFAYSHSDNAEPHRATSFFDTAGNTVQMAHMIACAVSFREGFKSPLEPLVAPLTLKKEREIFRKDLNQYNLGWRGLGLDFRNALLNPIAVDITGSVKELPKTKEIPAGQKTFNNISEERIERFLYNLETKDRGFTSIQLYGAALFTGFVDEGKEYPFSSGTTIQFGKTNLGWATVSWVEAERGRLLLTATGEMLNTNMKIEQLDGDKVTVGNRWGKEPVRCEGIPATIKGKGYMPFKKFWVLDESGNRKKEIPIEKTDEGWSIELKPEYKTIWYEIE
ncbi:MAG: carbohydrate binding domain-containing protein [Planctomycetaceae bacterium]|jgi:hypothetical protein|nr:carbohydrate binding domain-containing protein [Planctomycetaceae bacterium]